MGGIGRQRLVLAKALHRAEHAALVEDQPTFADHVLGPGGHLQPLVDVEVALALLLGHAEGLAQRRVPDHNVGV